MWARVARFEGGPVDIDARLERLRSALDGGTFAPEIADAKFLMLVDRTSGGMVGVTLSDSEEAMRKGDEAMNIRTFVDPQNRSRVAVLMDVADLDVVMGAMQTEPMAEAMAHDGVLPETLVILVEA